MFKNNIEKRIRSLPEIDGLSKETVLSSWMAKFDQIFRGDDDPRKRPQRQSAATSEMIFRVLPLDPLGQRPRPPTITDGS